ncbi:hypothetical protein BRADI_5g21615v3 [Brachypodium distachyon]|uniref:Uncharacterized protein n=1 Tax=Brachypodium distachyon TaxID=15368 RepID=A0A0Q3EDN1_BRADI|nr:hypothetical protein BRADI_5g21615v3 [Brachypodium distachyon]
MDQLFAGQWSPPSVLGLKKNLPWSSPSACLSPSLNLRIPKGLRATDSDEGSAHVAGRSGRAGPQAGGGRNSKRPARHTAIPLLWILDRNLSPFINRRRERQGRHCCVTRQD